VAAIYARGRFSVRAVHARRAPPEIRELGETLDLMAETILERDRSLHESLAQKDGLMREIHHRVKNNLQIISSMVSMQQRALSDPAARAVMHDTRQRISALALVYRALYQGPDLRQVDLKSFLEELTAQLVVPESAHGHVVKTELSADQLIIDPDKLAPLALFSVEAITNAQKHAFSGRGGELTVHFRVRGDEATLEIADSGGEDRAAPPALGEGVGRRLMTAFARQLGGRADFEANERGGLTARLIFPAPAETQRFYAEAPEKLERNQASA
jgi:two-component sensor histidine kinase